LGVDAGTISICGATLVFQSFDFLDANPTHHNTRKRKNSEKSNTIKYQLQIDFSSLVFPSLCFMEQSQVDLIHELRMKYIHGRNSLPLNPFLPGV